MMIDFDEDDEDDDMIFVMTILTGVMWYNSVRNRSKLTRSAVLQPSMSPWQHLYTNGDDSSFLEMTGFNKISFMCLETCIFEEVPVQRSAGRPRSLDNSGYLGLFLFYVGSQMKTKHLCLIFGIIPSTANSIIVWMLKVVCKKLKNNEYAKVSFPDPEKMAEFASIIQLREPLVDNVIGFVDGLSLPVQCSDNECLQNAAYNGYSHDTCCNNVFAFSPEGKVIYSSFNYPGSWHDSIVASDLINVVVENIGHYALCVDQGFPRSGDLHGRFVGPMTRRMRRKLSPEIAEYLIPLHEKYISLRQASEWGMRALQGTFSRLKSRLTSDGRKRNKIILSIVLLHNFRTEFVGLNQIASVFNPHYDQYINLSTYDRIQRYFNN